MENLKIFTHIPMFHSQIFIFNQKSLKKHPFIINPKPFVDKLSTEKIDPTHLLFLLFPSLLIKNTKKKKEWNYEEGNRLYDQTDDIY